MYDIVIAYRCYPKVSKTPFLRANDKLAMICGGLQSMATCLGTLKAKFYIIDDGCPKDRHDRIIASVSGHDYEYITTDKIGNYGTFKKQMEILLSQNESEYIYFAEDDYVYSNTGFAEALSLLHAKQSDFVTLFDHRGHYTARHHSINHTYILNDEKRIRKTLASTCMTFMTTKTCLKNTEKYFLKYCKGVRDYPLWLGLTKYNSTRIIDIDRTYKDKGVPASWLHIGMLWIKCRKQLLFGKRYRLYGPVPSIATHLETEDKAPLVDRLKIGTSP